MMYNVAQFISRALILLTIIVLASARPQHFGEPNQEATGDINLLQDALAREYLKLELQKMMESEVAAGDGDTTPWKMTSKRQANNNRLRCYFNPPLTNEAEAVNANEITPGLSNAQLEILARRLAEYNNDIPSGWDPRWDRIVRAPEVKRQKSFRQCYFNPVSCFKK